jgi:hypothetical protein
MLELAIGLALPIEQRTIQSTMHTIGQRALHVA